MKYYLAAKTSALVLCLFLNQGGEHSSIQALKLSMQEQQNFISDHVREIAARAPEMGNLQRKLEALEALRPRLQSDLSRIDEVLRPLPLTCDVPDPGPIRVKVVAAPEPTPVVIEAPAKPAPRATAVASPIIIGGSAEPGSIPELARKALDSIKSAGGSPSLEESIGSVAKKALGALGDGDGYAKVGGSGAQASLQTSARHSSDSVSSLAKNALESLEGGSGSSSSGSRGEELPSLAKQALRSLDGGSGRQRTAGLASGDGYQGDDVAALARQAIRQMDGGPGQPGQSDQVADLARGALSRLDGGASPRSGPANYGGSETAELAARAAQKLQSSNQVVAPQPAPNADEDGEADALSEKAKGGKKKHKKQKLAGKEEDSKDSQADEGGDDADDGRAAIANAKKQLKKLHKLNKHSNAFLASGSATTMGSQSRSHAHEGSQSDSPMLQGEAKPTVEEITEKALRQTENSEPPSLTAKKQARADQENEGFIRDFQEAASYGVNIRKPLYDEDEKENREKVDEAISAAGDKGRKQEVTEAVEAKMEENGSSYEELSLAKMKAYTDRIEKETDAKVAEIEKKEALARERKAATKPKKSHYEKEYNKARATILKEEREAREDKETMDKIEDKEGKKEREKKEKKIDKKLEKAEKKEQKKELKLEVEAKEKQKQEEIEEEAASKEVKAKEEEDAEKGDVEKEIESAVTKAETEGKIPSEAALKKAEDKVKVAAADTKKLSQRNSDPEKEDEDSMIIRI